VSEQPEEMLDPDAPAGTPVQRQVARNAAPVWCAHGVRWSPTDVGYVADDALNSVHHGHDVPALEVGAIPCGPTYASREAWERLTLARETQRVLEQDKDR
jgi:hypothetical protein